MSARIWLPLLAVGLCLPLSGCVIYNPVKVWWFTFDYNSERQLAFQASGYDHLPPRVVRMRLTRWAYNVGPSPVPATMIIPEGSPVAPESSGGPQLPPPALPPTSSDLLDESQPPELLPAAPRPTNRQLITPTPPVGPSARRPPGTRQISYESTGTIGAKPPATSSAWLFSSP